MRSVIMSLLRPRVLFSRNTTDDSETLLPDLQNPYERPNAIKTDRHCN